MDEIYEEMKTRNVSWLVNNSLAIDELLNVPELDKRKCIALIAQNHIELLDTEKIDKICEPLRDHWVQPKVHSTFIVLRGWDTEPFKNEDWSPLKKIIEESLSSYEIIFDRVIPVKTGLVLCGIPTIDINSVRDKIRDAGYETNVLYKCDIAHTTVLRWTSIPPNQNEWLEKITKLPKIPYAKIKVTGFDIVLASWTMKEGTAKILDSVFL